MELLDSCFLARRRGHRLGHLLLLLQAIALRTNKERAGSQGAFRFPWDWAVKASRGGIAATLDKVWEVLEALMGSLCQRCCTNLAREYSF